MIVHRGWGGRVGWRAHPIRWRRDTSEAGQATAEFALVFPFVVLLLLLIMQLGFVVRDHVRVAHASREAARAASVETGDGRARDVVRHLLGDADVLVERTGGIGTPLTATVKYRARTDVPIIGALLPDLTITDSTTMRAEQE